MRTPQFAVAFGAAILTIARAGVAASPEAQPTGRELTFAAPDGVELAATYRAAAAAGPGVLLLHMCNSDRSAWRGLGERLAARGIHSLALDYRGYGGSKGERHTDPRRQQQQVAEVWPGDVDAAYAALLAQPGVDRTRIAAAGGSCGVNQAIQLARRHAEVSTLVLLAGPTNQDGEAFLEANAWLPILAVASHDDGDAANLMRWLLGFSANPANRLLEYERGGHGTELFAVHADLEPAIVDWLARHLIETPVVRTTATDERREPSPSVVLYRTLREPGGGAKALAVRREAHARGAAPPTLPPEGTLNGLGYELLGAGRASDAVDVFRLNAEAHPKSANVWDSLADAYLADGRREESRVATEKSLALLATDGSLGEDFRRQLREAAEGRLRQLAAAPTGD